MRIAGIGVVVVGELGEDRGVHGVQDPSGGVMSIDPRKSRSHKPADDSAVFHLGPGAARTAVWRRAVMASRRVLLLVGPCRVDGGEAAATGDLGGLEDVDKAPSEALTAAGASRTDTIFCAIVPAAMPSFITTSLFALEKATRSSVVLGLVGVISPEAISKVRT